MLVCLFKKNINQKDLTFENVFYFEGIQRKLHIRVLRQLPPYLAVREKWLMP